MIARSFQSVLWVGAVGVAALGCYMVSLNVASERASLERTEARIIAAKRDIRALETELGTRSRLTQLERWNVEVLALSAPGEGQFVGGTVQLASLVRPKPVVDLKAPVRMAKLERAPAPGKRPVVVAAAPAPKPRLILASLQEGDAAE